MTVVGLEKCVEAGIIGDTLLTCYYPSQFFPFLKIYIHMIFHKFQIVRIIVRHPIPPVEMTSQFEKQTGHELPRLSTQYLKKWSKYHESSKFLSDVYYIRP